MGCVLVFFIFWFFYKVYLIGDLDGVYKVFYVVVYRLMVLIGVEGFSVFLLYCLEICYCLFVVVVLINLFCDFFLRRIG